MYEQLAAYVLCIDANLHKMGVLTHCKSYKRSQAGQVARCTTEICTMAATTQRALGHRKTNMVLDDINLAAAGLPMAD